MAAPHRTRMTMVNWNSALHRVGDFVPNIPVGETFENTYQFPLSKQDKARAGALYGGMSFSTQIAGSGSAGTAPADGTLWKACGLKETTVAVTSVSYASTGDLVTDVTATSLEAAIGNAYKCSLSNAVGNARMEFIAGQPAKVYWDFSGTYNIPTEGTITSSALSTSATPLVCKGLTATYAGQTVVLRSATINLNNELHSPRYDIAGTNGVQAPLIVNHAPSYTVLIETPALSTLNLWSLFSAETKGRLTMTLGASAGNICTITIDGYMNASPAASDDGGLLAHTLSYRMSWAAADSQLSLVYT